MWLEVNQNTPFPLKLKILYSCMLPALLYSCEAWGPLKDLEHEIRLIEKKALKACLGVKQGTSDEIIYMEVNRADYIAIIYERQYKFYNRFKMIGSNESTAKCIWEKYQRNDLLIKPFVDHYEAIDADTR